MKEIKNKIEQVRKESSAIKKIKLLKKFMKDEKFCTVVSMALDETMHYNVSRLVPLVPKRNDPNFDTLMDYLYYLSQKQGANLEEKKELSSFAINSDWEYVILRIINKDLKCGAQAKMINKAVPGTIEIMPYMRYKTSKYLDGIKFPAFAQRKEDGLFCNLFWNNKTVKYLSRNGNEFLFPEDSLANQVRQYYPMVSEPLVYMGEFRIKVNGKWLPRKTSNGLVNKALKKNQSMPINLSTKTHFICWDVVPAKAFWNLKFNVPYEHRFKNLDFLKNTCGRHQLSETKIVNSIKEAQNLALELISQGEEGIMLKNFSLLWKNSDGIPDGVKLKAGSLGINNERECELHVINWYYGKKGTKFENCLGGLICESEDHKLETNIGGGFKEKERGFLGWDKDGTPQIRPNIEKWIEDEYMYEIITVRFNEVIKAETSKKHSLFSARFIEKREDKSIADTLEYIKEIK